MPLIVEDGTGLSTAESYISVADASAYHSSIGNAAWAALASDTLREQLLRKATIYLKGEYHGRWTGVRYTTSQALDWPRSLSPIKDSPVGAYYATNLVPQDVKNACASLALRAATAPLVSDQTRTKSSVTVGPISTTYQEGSSTKVRYVEIDQMLSPYLRSGSGLVRMVRS